MGDTASTAAALAAAQRWFVQAHPESHAHHTTAAQSLPGGNTRSVLHTPPFPLVMRRGTGPHLLWDVDGHRYTDLVGELSAGLYGHAHPTLRAAVLATFDHVGLSLGATTPHEAQYAALLCARFALARVRFTPSGTEANLHALNAAKAFTGREKVAVFGGGYHGAVLSFGGDGEHIAPNNVDKDSWVVGRYNDVASARAVIEGTPGLAAVLVEGMQGAAGCISGTEAFLHQVQESAKRAGAVFILDEVFTSRLSPSGLQGRFGLKPDLITLGKWLGGGFAFGAFGGRADIMAVYDPRSSSALGHSGTFNNNTMAMCVGYAGLSQIWTPEVGIAFNNKGDEFRKRLQQVTKGTKCSFTGMGSLLAVHFSDSGREDIRSVEDVQERLDLKDLFWFDMLKRGFWITRRGSISLILDTPTEELDRFVDCVAEFLQTYQDIMRI